MDALTSQFAELEKRLVAMEKNQHRLRILSLVLFVSTVLMTGEAVLAPRKRSVVEAERFVVRDAKGHRRAELGLGSVGLPELNLYDDQDRVQIGLQVFADRSSSLAFHDGTHTQLSIEASGDGTSAIRLLDQEDMSHATLYMLPKGRSGLALNHERESVLLGVNPGTAPGLVVTDVDGVETGSVGGSNVTARSFGVARFGVPDQDKPIARAAVELTSPISPRQTVEMPSVVGQQPTVTLPSSRL